MLLLSVVVCCAFLHCKLQRIVDTGELCCFRVWWCEGILFFEVSLPAVPRLSSCVISSAEGNQIANALGHKLH